MNTLNSQGEITESPRHESTIKRLDQQEGEKHLPFATKEQLQEWYKKENGEQIIKTCIEANNYKLEWKAYAKKYNIENTKNNGWQLQTTVDGVIQAFGSRKFNKYNFWSFLSGKKSNEHNNHIPGIKRGIATPERLISWYQSYGHIIIEKCKNAKNPYETWKILSTEYNNNHALEQGWYLPTTINGIIYVFGVKSHSFYNCVKLLSGEKLTQGEMDSDQNKHRATYEQLIEWYNKKGGKEIIQVCRTSGNFIKSWKKYVEGFIKKDFYILGYRLPNNIVGLVSSLGGNIYTIKEMVRLFEQLPEGSKIPEIVKNVRGKTRITIISAPKEKSKKIKQGKVVKTKTPVVKKTLCATKTAKTPAITKQIRDSVREIAVPKNETLPKKEPISQEKELSEWMIDYSRRFPNFLLIHRKYYLAFRKFIQALEKAYPGEPEIDYKQIEISVDIHHIMLITIKKSYIFNHNSTYILNIFDETEASYKKMCEKNIRYPLIDINIRVES